MKTFNEFLNEGKNTEYSIFVDRRNKTKEIKGTLEYLIDYFSYTLEVGASWEHERGNKKINRNPKSIISLVDNLNKAVTNSAANGNPSEYYYMD